MLNFSNRTFPDFVLEKTGRLIYDDPRYACAGDSKAKRLRTFWRVESKHIAAKLIEALIEYESRGTLRERRAEHAAFGALAAETKEPEFEVIAQQARRSGEESTGGGSGTGCTRTRSSLYGLSAKNTGAQPQREASTEPLCRVREASGGHLHSETTARILRSTIFDSGSLQPRPQQPEPRASVPRRPHEVPGCTADIYHAAYTSNCSPC